MSSGLFAWMKLLSFAWYRTLKLAVNESIWLWFSLDLKTFQCILFLTGEELRWVWFQFWQFPGTRCFLKIPNHFIKPLSLASNINDNNSGGSYLLWLLEPRESMGGSYLPSYSFYRVLGWYTSSSRLSKIYFFII